MYSGGWAPDNFSYLQSTVYTTAHCMRIHITVLHFIRDLLTARVSQIIDFFISSDVSKKKKVF